MDFNAIPLFNIMKAKLNYLSERQATLAANIANADTPGYKAQDVTPPDFTKMVQEAGVGQGQRLHMTVTNPKHITHSASVSGQYQVITSPATDELKPDGNNVSIEEQMAKVSANQMDYQKIISMYGKTITMFKTAIGSSSG